MNNHFRAISLSYKSAPVAIRESVSLNEEQSKLLLNLLRQEPEISDLLVISTCNRTEVYYASPQNYRDNILAAFAEVKQIANIADYQEYFVNIDEPIVAVRHLFHVAMGLESQVVGDLQISNQIKNAYQWAADMGTAGPFLHRLMHTIFFTNKRVVQETAFRTGAASTSYAAVEWVEEIAADLISPKVLVLGLGEIGADVFLNLQNSNIEHIMLCNRTLAKTAKYAENTRAEVVPFEKAWQAIAEADIIISSVATAHPFVTKDRLEALNILSFKYFIDLSMPRSVAPDVEQVNGVLAYNIDDIKNKASQALERRLQAIPAVERIIEESLADFEEWTKEMNVSPTIQKLKNALEQIRMEELDRYFKELNDEEREKVDKITKSMMQKIIKYPVLHLKAACKRGEADTLIDVLSELFDLEKQPVLK
ncbi:glutamyl-tRNA reductase [Eisenibacter elegans]|uniref:glutamyl-tRNA reductase n=1 Tax=Eisenibacter elegans TaxID=997 RepID=UPI00047A34EB|nr:glutamyl-tRNA reductase [Eisenibacter elegans]